MPPYDLKSLNNRHKRLCELYLDGVHPSTIAEQLGVKKGTVLLLLRQPLVQDYVARRRRERLIKTDEVRAVGPTESIEQTERALSHDEVTEKLRSLASTAVGELKKLLGSDNERVRLNATKQVLDLAYGGESGGSRSGEGTRIYIAAGDMKMLQVALDESVESVKQIEHVVGEA